MNSRRRVIDLIIVTVMTVCMGGIAVAKAIAHEHVVEAKRGSVEKQGQQDAQRAEQVNPKSAGPVQFEGQTHWLIETLTFRPPAPRKFKSFPNGGFVDIIPASASAFPDKPETETADAIQLNRLLPAAAGEVDADTFPLVLEGNLTNPGGGGIPVEHYWAAKIAKDSGGRVLFSDDPVVTGFTLKQDANAIGVDLVAYVTGTIDVNEVTITDEDPNNRIAALGPMQINGQNKTITFDVKGQSATPAVGGQPADDARILAIHNGSEVGITPVRVVVPASRTHNVPQPVLVNEAELLPNNGGTKLRSRVEAVIQIRIFDQFGDPLNEVYNADGVVEEKFSDLQQIVFPNADFGQHPAFTDWVTIVEPDDRLRYGVKRDRVHLTVSMEVGTNFTEEQLALWRNQQLGIILNGISYKNLFAYRLDQHDMNEVSVQFDMDIKVHGHPTSPTMRRQLAVSRGQGDSIDIVIDDDDEE